MSEEIRESLRLEVEDVFLRYQVLLESIKEGDLSRRSGDPTRSVGELLLHMVFAVRLIPPSVWMLRTLHRAPESFEKPFGSIQEWSTPLYNWVILRTSRVESRALTRGILSRKYQRAHERLIRTLESIKKDEWRSGMPFSWDPDLGTYVTIEKLFHYPKIHFELHLPQVYSTFLSEETEQTRAFVEELISRKAEIITAKTGEIRGSSRNVR